MPDAIRRLKKIDVSFISLVDKGANGKTIVFKSAGASEPNLKKIIPIIKTDEEKHLVYGTVYEPDTADSQGDIADAIVIEKSAHEFLATLKNTNVDTQHDFNPDDGAVVESYILRAADPMFPETKIGAWVVAIKVSNPDTWELVKKGELSGLSLAGLAAVEPIEKKNAIVEKMITRIKKDFNSELAERNVWQYLYALEDAIRDILDDETITDKKASINATISQFSEAMSGIPVIKTGKTISANNLGKLKSAVKELNDLITLSEPEEETEITTKSNGDIMKPEELKAVIDEALKPVNEKLSSLEKAQEKIITLETANAELVKRVETVEKATPGSRQEKTDTEEVRKNDNSVKIWT